MIQVGSGSSVLATVVTTSSRLSAAAARRLGIKIQYQEWGANPHWTHMHKTMSEQRERVQSACPVSAVPVRLSI